MGKGGSEEWDEKRSEPKRTQPQKEESERRGSDGGSGGGCPKCCLRTRDFLMSAECGRCLQISSVIAFCGTCIRMWMCECLLWLMFVLNVCMYICSERVFFFAQMILLSPLAFKKRQLYLVFFHPVIVDHVPLSISLQNVTFDGGNDSILQHLSPLCMSIFF